VLAWFFAEGYTSDTVDTAAKVDHRAFTIVGGQEACDKSPMPAEFRVKPRSIYLKIGDRLYRDDLIIEAYDEDGKFISSVPIVIQILGRDDLLKGGSDRDYVEAVSTGTGRLLVGWRCPGEPVQVSVTILVTA
jgi:hypothetical protein